MKAFDIAVLPPTAGIDIDRLDPVFFEPLLDFVGDKFEAVIAADIRLGCHTAPSPAKAWLTPGRRSVVAPQGKSKKYSHWKRCKSTQSGQDHFVFCQNLSAVKVIPV